MDDGKQGIGFFGASIRNFMRISYAEFEVTGDGLLKITGKNAQGKTSFLRAIEGALGGAKLLPDEPIAEGSDTAEVTIDLGDLTVRRTFKRTENGEWNTYLYVTGKDGGKYNQSALDRFMGKIGFDPLAFATMKGDKQTELIQQLVPLDIDLHDWQMQRYQIEESTKTSRAEVTRQTKALEVIPYHPDAPPTKVDSAAIIEQMNQQQRQRQHIAEQERQFNTAKSARDHTRIRIEDAEAKIAELQKTLETYQRTATEQDDLLKRLETELEEMRSAGPDDAALVSLQNELLTAEATNEKVRQNDQYESAQGDLAQAKQSLTAAEEKLQAHDKVKADALAAAKLPVDGLSFDDKQVFYQGRSLEDCSTAEQITVSVGIGMALNPKLRLLLIRQGSLLDIQHQQLIAQLAEEHGFKVLMETVDDPDPDCILIEDGMIANKMPLPE